MLIYTKNGKVYVDGVEFSNVEDLSPHDYGTPLFLYRGNSDTVLTLNTSGAMPSTGWAYVPWEDM